MNLHRIDIKKVQAKAAAGCFPDAIILVHVQDVHGYNKFYEVYPYLAGMQNIRKVEKPYLKTSLEQIESAFAACEVSQMGPMWMFQWVKRRIGDIHTILLDQDGDFHVSYPNYETGRTKTGRFQSSFPAGHQYVIPRGLVPGKLLDQSMFIHHVGHKPTIELILGLGERWDRPSVVENTEEQPKLREQDFLPPPSVEYQKSVSCWCDFDGQD